MLLLILSCLILMFLGIVFIVIMCLGVTEILGSLDYRS